MSSIVQQRGLLAGVPKYLPIAIKPENLLAFLTGFKSENILEPHDLSCEYDGKALAPLKVPCRVALEKPSPNSKLCFRNSRMSKVYLNVYGSLIVIDVSDEERAIVGKDHTGNDLAGTINGYFHSINIDIDTVDHFGNRPDFVRRFDQVKRETLLLDICIAASVTLGGHIRITDPVINVASLDDAFMAKTFQSNIEVIGVHLDLMYVN